jgi:polyhydroxybutyrate depolymerase
MEHRLGWAGCAVLFLGACNPTVEAPGGSGGAGGAPGPAVDTGAGGTAGSAGAGGSPRDAAGRADGSATGSPDGGLDDGGAPSSGCGQPWMPPDVQLEPARGGRPAMQVVRRTIDLDGVPRDYLVAVPQGYSPATTHALVFGFHGSGGDREQLRRYLNLELPANGQAIMIYPSGLPPSLGGTSEWNLAQNSPDLVLVDRLIEQYAGELCIDRQRIFATGHSFGGCMTNAVGCFRGGVFRAIAPVAGCGPSQNARCVGKVAALQIHSPKDTQVRYATAIRLCTRLLRANACAEMPACGCNWTDQLTTPADQCLQQAQETYQTGVPVTTTAQDEQPAVLRAYQSCTPGFPSVFIDHWRREKATVGDPTERWHNPPPWSAAVIWEFFANLPR